jgi:hypothetical protein
MLTLRSGVLVLLAAAAVGAAALLAIGGAQLASRAQSGDAIGVFGMEAQLSLPELAREADLVVIGTAGLDQVRALTENAAVPPEARDGRIYTRGSYHDLTFSVLEYLKGSGPPSVSIRRSLSLGRSTSSSYRRPRAFGAGATSSWVRAASAWSPAPRQISPATDG